MKTNYKTPIKKTDKKTLSPKIDVVFQVLFGEVGNEGLAISFRVANNRKNFLTIVLANKLNIHIIELPKIEKCEEDADELLDWLYFLVNLKSERVENKMKENKKISRYSVHKKRQHK